jgi:hypothetical protein
MEARMSVAEQSGSGVPPLYSVNQRRDASATYLTIETLVRAGRAVGAELHQTFALAGRPKKGKAAKQRARAAAL